jgi:tRNA 2-thiouridine synthesizing protein C
MNKYLAILVRSEPYDRRGGRERLDPALAAASLDIPLKIFFVDEGVMHLLPQQQPASLPALPYTSAWAALTGLSSQVELFAESAAVELITGGRSDLLADVELLDSEAIAEKLKNCKMVIHV